MMVALTIAETIPCVRSCCAAFSASALLGSGPVASPGGSRCRHRRSLAADTGRQAPDSYPIALIRARYAQIERDTLAYRRTTHDLSDLYTGGEELTGYFVGDSLVKLTAWFRGESGRTRYEYFFGDGRLIFVNRVGNYSHRIVAEQGDTLVTRETVKVHTEDQYYFARGNLIRWIDSAGREASLVSREAIDWEAAFRGDVRKMEACARRAPAPSPVCPAEDTAAAIPAIRARYQRIERDLGHYQRIVHPLVRFGADSSGLISYFEDGELRKMKIVYTSVQDRPTEEYYVWDGEIFFVFRTVRTFGAKTATGWQVEEERLYFRDGELVKRIGAEFWYGPDKEWETPETEANGVLEYGQRLMRCAKAPSAKDASCENHYRE